MSHFKNPLFKQVVSLRLKPLTCAQEKHIQIKQDSRQAIQSQKLRIHLDKQLKQHC